MKKHKVTFWITTILIFLFEGVMPALTFNSDLAKEGITHLGYPIYFLYLLVAYKVLGSLALVIPQVPARVKEWAYAGFGLTFISAFVSHVTVDGFGAMALGPVIALLILTGSYTSYRKIHGAQQLPPAVN